MLYRTCNATIFLLSIILAPQSAPAQIASPGCAACRSSCVDARERCRDDACTSKGGKLAPGSCSAPVDYNAYVKALEACEKREDVCWEKCQDSQCK